MTNRPAGTLASHLVRHSCIGHEGEARNFLTVQTVFVNGSKATRPDLVLHSGDVVQVGALKFHI